MSNVYRLANAPAVLRSRKPRHRFRTFLEKFCALSPASRLRVMKAILADKDSTSSDPIPDKPFTSEAAFLLRNGISRSLWKRYDCAQMEAFRSEWPEHRR